MRDRFVSGTYNAICDECGFKFKATELRMRWDNFFVCSKCWEPRHPQDFVQGKVDSQRVPHARPDDTRFEATPVTRDQL